MNDFNFGLIALTGMFFIMFYLQLIEGIDVRWGMVFSPIILNQCISIALHLFKTLEETPNE